MKQHRLREGDVTAVDTKTALTTVGSDTAPGSLFVPQNMTHITKVRVAASENFAAATSFSGFIRLEGTGMSGGPQSLAVIAGGVPVATGGNGVSKVVEYTVNFPVVAGNIIEVYGEMCGTDIGGCTFVVGLEFSDKPNDGDDEHKTLTVEGDLTSADTRTALLTQGSISSPTLAVPAGYTKLVKLGVAAAAEGLADGKAGFIVRVGGNAVQGGEQIFPISAAGRIAPQAGSDSAPQKAEASIWENLDIVVSPSDTISFWGEMVGDDIGTGRMVVTAIFAK